MRVMSTLRFILPVGFLCVMLTLLSGCFSSSKYSEFQQTFNFASLDHYAVREVTVTGFHLKEGENAILESLSKDTVAVEMGARGFSSAEPADFYWVLNWHKASTFNPSALDSINGFRTELNDRNDPAQHIATRWKLTLEAYLPDQESPFWIKELPNIFDAIEFTEWRIVASIERGLKNFPQRVAKDPNLPDIE